MNNRPIVGISMGDPFGNGPEITVRALSDKAVYESCRPLVVGDKSSMEYAIDTAKKIFGTELKLHTSKNVGEAGFEYGKIDVLDIKALDDPSEIIAEREYFESMENKIKEALSEFELQVLHEYEKGKSYADIAIKLNAKVKSVDTAIQRIKKKANKIRDNIK